MEEDRPNRLAKVSDDPGIGLLAIRELLISDGFVDDPRPVYWYGTNLRPDDSDLTELLGEMSTGASCFLEHPDHNGHLVKS